ncbi:hypothetical protein TNCV_2419561 [Trichonephila clavipes]|nr:hypothetical protein TNCV_2419561 [Trichonephila clavipes]
MDSYVACHEFDSCTAEDPPCREVCRYTSNLPRVKRPLIGMVWKLEKPRGGRGDGKREEKESGEREEPALDGEKGLVRDWSGKTMNARGVENGI